jgi:hypothetical protein
MLVSCLAYVVVYIHIWNNFLYNYGFKVIYSREGVAGLMTRKKKLWSHSIKTFQQLVYRVPPSLHVVCRWSEVAARYASVHIVPWSRGPERTRGTHGWNVWNDRAWPVSSAWCHVPCVWRSCLSVRRKGRKCRKARQCWQFWEWVIGLLV